MQKAVSRDGTVIAYDRTGEGPALVLVGGAYQVREDPRWAVLAGLLGDRFTVVTYDRRGRGDSGDTAPYAVEREIEDLAAVIAELEGPVRVMGMSSGAVLALEAAAHGVPIAELALYEPPFVVDDSRLPVPADYIGRLEAALADGRRDDAVTLMLTAAVNIPAEYLGPMRDSVVWGHFTALAHTLPYDARVMGDTMTGRPLPADRWAGVRIPVLAIGGGASDPWLRSGARALAGLLPAGRHRTLEGQTHDVDPAALAPALAEFYGRDES
ncbi:alpha/beta fold hydrolase [Streptomyces sp. NBC_00091]|uniref:alpha/beta fold hydrolase n=1 Tax=Streptomyces sp. NBC_00091 TaxID=2975648 RepID=UPI00224E71F8|nr:alpha/beta hydrolase [Streptomyces sp. NBC_00091]MCX5377503.1 alpha/beta fold hydrolase [Streptomyces sp. NBC_00091]